MKNPMSWTVGYSENEDNAPKKMVPAAVPGNVQVDWAKSLDWGHYTYADNFKDYSWMEDVFWIYHTLLELPPLTKNNKIFFVCKGVDYKFKVILNGKVLFEQEGMFTPFELELTDIAATGDCLEVVIFPAPKRENAPVGRCEADQSVKPAVSYGWDFHPRLIPLGIWEETYLDVRESRYFIDTEVFYNLSEDYTVSDLELKVLLNDFTNTNVAWQFYDMDNNLLFGKKVKPESNTVVINEKIMNPELWWPNGQGKAYLYSSTISLTHLDGRVLEERQIKTGMRRAELVMYPGAWHAPNKMPRSRNNPPITMKINGREIFMKGSSWVNPDIMPGTITEETYYPLLLLAKEANMNLLRCWGGAIVNKESFFRLSDEMGIMIWQEFPLSCNNYIGTPEYLKVLDQESKSIIKRLRKYACITIWCGGNELFNSWSGMTDQALALRLLDRNCYDLDPHTPFIMTSPLGGMAHGNYEFVNSDGEEVFKVMPLSKNTAYAEFGCPSPSSADYLKTFIPEKDLFPPREGTAWETHHALNAWVGKTWLCPDIIEKYFGKPQTLEQLVDWGQHIQNEGYKCIFEEARRQKPVCSMALNWCFNEPWPTAANNSLLNWPAVIKPSYYAVKNSLRSVLASAKISKFSWVEGEIFDPELWILSDLPDPVKNGVVEAHLEIGEKKILLLRWEFGYIGRNSNQQGPTIHYKLPNAQTNRMTLHVSCAGDESRDSSYTLLYRPQYVIKKAKEEAKILNV